MLLAQRLSLPAATQGVVFDLDGVLVDTLALEARLVDEILARHVDAAPAVPPELVRSAFPLPIPDSWRAILKGIGREPSGELVEALTADLERARLERAPDVHDGVREIVADAASRLRVAVASNNPVAHVASILEATGIGAPGLVIVGNDQGLPSKPAPDMYVDAARRLDLPPGRCAAVEDSRLGARAARLAGCFVIGVATGAEDFASLAASPDVDRAYERFALPDVRLAPGDVTAKTLRTPNEFVSHMVEHIAWRAGCELTLRWHSDDWHALGRALGGQLAPLLEDGARAEAIGLIDDGSAEVSVARDGEGGLELLGDPAELDWFRGLRVEQLASGEGLERLLSGLASAAALRIRITVGSVEDAHHTWEAVFRGLGLALRDLSPALVRHARNGRVERRAPARPLGVVVDAASAAGAAVTRTTSESVCSARVAMAAGDFEAQLVTSPSVDMSGLPALLERLAGAAGVSGSVRFEATELSSSHVVAEDVGMTMGALFREVAQARMAEHGIEGSGWSTGPAPDGDGVPRVALSWEGRKFLKLLPVGWDERELRRFRVGTTLRSGLFSEDLDDFLDGFAGGMSASVMVHWPRTPDLDDAWAAIFEGLGAALQMALAPNHARRGLIAGVKATLA